MMDDRSANDASFCKEKIRKNMFIVIMRKPDFCLCENKGADQLRSNCSADPCFCFLYTDITLSPPHSHTQIFKILAFFCDCTDWFVSDLVGNPKRLVRIAAYVLRTLG